MLLTSLGIPCLYYGFEQGFDGGGGSDFYVRETMFGAGFGGLGTVDASFFNPEHPIYKAIAKIAAVREKTAALRYGRQYFREISGDGEHFGHPIDGKSTLAYSRVLDTEEVIIAINLDPEPRNDCIMVDPRTTGPDTPLEDLLGGVKSLKVEQVNDIAFVRVPLPGRSLAILQVKSGKQPARVKRLDSHAAACPHFGRGAVGCPLRASLK